MCLQHRALRRRSVIAPLIQAFHNSPKSACRAASLAERSSAPAALVKAALNPLTSAHFETVRQRQTAPAAPQRAWGAYVRITRETPAAPRQLEIYLRYASRETVLVFELRKLLFWLALLLLTTHASSFKITPAFSRHGLSQIIHSDAKPAILNEAVGSLVVDGVTDTLMSNGNEAHVVDLVARAALGSGSSDAGKPPGAKDWTLTKETLSQPVFGELAKIIVTASPLSSMLSPDGVGALAGLLQTLAGHVLRGEVSMEVVRSAAVRSCFSVGTHKLVVAGKVTATAVLSQYGDDVLHCILLHS